MVDIEIGVKTTSRPRACLSGGFQVYSSFLQSMASRIGGKAKYDDRGLLAGSRCFHLFYRNDVLICGTRSRNAFIHPFTREGGVS